LPVLPTVDSAVFPAGTPESATDFFGLGAAAGGASLPLMRIPPSEKKRHVRRTAASKFF
jgi:hypothetical protein